MLQYAAAKHPPRIIIDRIFNLVAEPADSMNTAQPFLRRCAPAMEDSAAPPWGGERGRKRSLSGAIGNFSTTVAKGTLWRAQLFLLL